MLTFYSNLPVIKDMEQYFYVPGYTEALAFYPGARLILNEGFLLGLPQPFHEYIYSVGFPCYFVPQFQGDKCYGFTLKGLQKKTPSYSTQVNALRLNEINEGDTVWLVEGIKDSYLPLYAGEKVIPMDTSVPNEKLLLWLIDKKCNIVYCPDNDTKRERHVGAFYNNKLSKLDLKESSVTWVAICVVEDFGDYFVPELRHAAIEAFRTAREGVRQWQQDLKKL